MELATGRDSFTGANINNEQARDRAFRWLGIILPGHMSGTKMGFDTVEMWNESEPHRRDAIIRIVSASTGLWLRGARGLHEGRIRDLYQDMDTAIDEANALGLDVATLTDLQDSGAILPGQGKRLQLGYGVQVQRTDPEFDEEKPLDVQRRPITRAELLRQLPDDVKEAFGYTSILDPDEYDNGQEYWDAVYEQEILGSLNISAGLNHNYAEVVAKRVFSDRRVQAAVGVTPQPTARDVAEFDLDNEVNLALRELTRYGISLPQVQAVAPYLSATMLDVARMGVQVCPGMRSRWRYWAASLRGCSATCTRIYRAA